MEERTPLCAVIIARSRLPLRYEHAVGPAPRGSSSGSVVLRAHDQPVLRRELVVYLTGAVIGPVGG